MMERTMKLMKKDQKERVAAGEARTNGAVLYEHRNDSLQEEQDFINLRMVA